MEAFRDAVRVLIKRGAGDPLWKGIGVLLLFSLVPLAEIFLFIFIGTLIGNYLTLMAAAVIGLFGGAVVLRQVPRVLAKVKSRLRYDEHPGKELADLAGMLAGCALLVTPGFITDVLGLLLFIPALRKALGGALVKRLERSGYSLKSLVPSRSAQYQR
jgi:UPF0716 protein FxsA